MKDYTLTSNAQSVVNQLGHQGILLKSAKRISRKKRRNLKWSRDIENNSVLEDMGAGQSYL